MLKFSQMLVFLAVIIDTLPWTFVSETQLRNAQIYKASFVNNGIVKTCQIVDKGKKNWLWMIVAGCRLY